MVVRIRLGRGPHPTYRPGKQRRLALTLAAFLSPAALMAASLAGWRLAADLNWTRQFAISAGLFSHWQVWIAMAVTLQLAASRLNRYGRGGRTPP